MRRIKLPQSFPPLSFAATGISLRQVVGPLVATITIIFLVAMFLTGGLRLNLRESKPVSPINSLPGDLTQVGDQGSRLSVSGNPAPAMSAEEDPLHQGSSVGPIGLRSQADVSPVMPESKRLPASVLASNQLAPGAVVTPVVTKSIASLRKDDESIRILSIRLDPSQSNRFPVGRRDDPSGLDDWCRQVVSSLQSFDLIVMQGVPRAWETFFRRWVTEPALEAKWELLSGDPSLHQRESGNVWFLWDNARLQCPRGRHYLVKDTAGRFSQAPMVANFEARVGGIEGRSPFRFTLIHAIPEPKSQVKPFAGNGVSLALEDLFVSIRRFEFESNSEDDCILIGDWGRDAFCIGRQAPGIRARDGEQTDRHFASNLFGLQSGDPNLGELKGSLQAKKASSEPSSISASAMHLVFDSRYTNEYMQRSSPANVSLSRMTSSEVTSEVTALTLLGFDTFVWGEFAASESPRFESIANQPVHRMAR